VGEAAGSNRQVLDVAEQLVHARRLRDVDELGRDILAALDRHGVLTDATAIAFRMLFALAFLVLTGLAFAGAVNLQGIWSHQIGPNVARVVSPNFYRELDRSVDQVLTVRRWWWLSVGMVLTLWQVSSGVRALMTALDSIYEVKDRRPFWGRMFISIGLAVVIILSLFLIGATWLVLLASPPAGMPAHTGFFALGVIVTGAILLVMVSLLLRFTTPEHLQVRWATLGSFLSLLVWLLATWLVGWYLATFGYRTYQEAFGVLALLIVAMTYLYVAAVAFLIGAELDALLVTEAKARTAR
jgi:membrane protein